MVKPSQIKATQKYVANHYDRIVITVPKGERDIIKAAASKTGESMNAFIVAAINERIDRMERDADKVGQ